MEESLQDKIIKTAESLNKDYVDNNNIPRWTSYIAVQRFKSVKRAIRRGHVELFTGIMCPSRPFNNRTSKKGSRPFNELAKDTYRKLKYGNYNIGRVQ